MKRSLSILFVLALLLVLAPGECWARGFGGGLRGGGGFGGFGGGRSFGGGGFGGGSRFGGGGFSGLGGGGLGGSGFDHGSFGGGGEFGGLSGGGNRFGGGGLSGLGGGGDRFGGGGLSGLGGGNRFGGGGLSQDGFGDRFSGAGPSRSQLGNFLGLPSDEGMHGLSGGISHSSGTWSNDFDVHHGAALGPRGGYAAGTSVTGPRGNTAYRGAAVGPYGGVAAGRGVVGAGGAAAGQGVVAGPGGRVAAGGAVRGPYGGVAARGVVAGPRGYAAGFAAVSPSGRYATAVGVRGHFNHWNYFRPDWYTRNPAAWYAAGWAAGAAWEAATWDALDNWFAYSAVQPVYYDYGNNVTYENNSVYINGQDAGTSQQYYDSAETLATTGASAEAPSDGDWLPLGVFALCRAGQTSSDLILQLAVNQDGIIRGNYTDGVSGKSNLVHGSVDKKTQRVAFTVGDIKTTVVETGLYNLTKDEAPCLIHYGADRTEQWMLVRLKQDQQQDAQPQSPLGQ
jgi:hypothetical protein